MITIPCGKRGEIVIAEINGAVYVGDVRMDGVYQPIREPLDPEEADAFRRIIQQVQLDTPAAN